MNRLCEQDAEELIKSVNECVNEVMERQEKCRVEAVGITNERETTVVWKKIDGKPLHNAISEERVNNTYMHASLVFLLQCGVITVQS